jgi:hypothetical protein
MANNLSPPALKSKKSSDHLLEKEKYDPLFLQDNVENDDYTKADTVFCPGQWISWQFKALQPR